MSRPITTAIVRFWPILLLGWIALLVCLMIWAPHWEQIGKSGQFSYLPANSPSSQAEALFEKTFPGQHAASTIVLVATRTDGGVLQPADKAFINDVVTPRLKELLLPKGKPAPDSPVQKILAPGESPSSVLLHSPDHCAELIVIDLTTEFLDAKNWPTVAAVERLIHELPADHKPADLSIALTGSAVLGRDTGESEAQSAQAVQRWTIVVVVALLLLVYRAPLLAIIPLITVFVGVEVALRLLSVAANAWNLNLYQGVSIYVTIVGYGAGVDYCLFMIARCREEWKSRPNREAVQEALANVGPAIIGSAATVITGIAMLGFAAFGKIEQAGLGIAFSLVIVLLAALSLTPSLLRLTGRFVLWPWHNVGPETAGVRVQRFWEAVGRRLARRPRTFAAVTMGAMAPFAVVAIVHWGDRSYDLTRNVPDGAPSVAGLKVLREHFAAGATGPIVALIQDDQIDFRSPEGIAAVTALANRLKAQASELDLADVRSVSEPFGDSKRGREEWQRVSELGGSIAQSRSADHYVSADGHVARLDIILTRSPFSGRGMTDLSRVERAVRADLPSDLQGHAQTFFLGPAAGMRDLETVTTSDGWRVDVLVVIAVFLVLLALLRRPGLSAYLILTVVLGFLTTLGITFLIFDWISPEPFAGLDWRVPLFLFTILVAVGEDYNIFLVTRVREEVREYGTVEGVVVAEKQTGGVITSCGLIMAGTFASLFAGTLSEMHQMAFALSFGVLLDTIVVRPVLVPAFLVLIDCWPGGPNATCKGAI